MKTEVSNLASGRLALKSISPLPFSPYQEVENTVFFSFFSKREWGLIDFWFEANWLDL